MRSACSALTNHTSATASFATRGHRHAHAQPAQFASVFTCHRAWLQVLRPQALAPLRVKLGHIEGPDTMGIPGQAGHYMGQFNPSIVPAPDGLCPRCAYLVSLRIDPLHQCSRRSPLFTPPRGLRNTRTLATAWFRNTALALLDAKFEVITWTWLLATPHAQINPRWAYKNYTIDFGPSDGFRPPWTGQIYDLRLFNLHGRIFATCACAKCNFALMLLTVTGDVTADGGLVHLRAWRQTAQRYISWHPWAQGRNQAIFAATPARDSQTVWQARGAGTCGGTTAKLMVTQGSARVALQAWLFAGFCVLGVRARASFAAFLDSQGCRLAQTLTLTLALTWTPRDGSVRDRVHPALARLGGQLWSPGLQVDALLVHVEACQASTRRQDAGGRQERVRPHATSATPGAREHCQSGGVVAAQLPRQASAPPASHQRQHVVRKHVATVSASAAAEAADTIQPLWTP